MVYKTHKKHNICRFYILIHLKTFRKTPKNMHFIYYKNDGNATSFTKKKMKSLKKQGNPL